MIAHRVKIVNHPQDINIMKQTIQIIPSVELQQLRLTELVGHTAVISEPIGPKGCWVMLHEPCLGHSDWFIPASSLVLINNGKVKVQ